MAPKGQREYPDDRFEKALFDIQLGKSVRQASKDHDIPNSIPHYKNHGNFFF